MTFRKFKILLRLWRQRGIKALVIRLAERTRNYLAQKRANIYTRLHRTAVIDEIRSFSSHDPEEVFHFAATKFLGGIAPGQIREEFIPLLREFQKLQPKTIVEIGTEKGGTLFCFSKLAPPDALIVSIELPPAFFGGGYPSWRAPIYQAFVSQHQTIHLLRGDSHAASTLEKLKEVLGGRPIDFLFIDADHSYYGVKQDFEMYGSLVRKGGMIAFHDIVPYPKEYDNQVSVFWNEIKHRYPSQEFVRDWNQRCCGIGILYL